MSDNKEFKPPVYDRKLLPVGTEIEVFDPEGEPDEMPVYSGQVESAFMTLDPGLYPFSLVSDFHPQWDDEYMLFVSPGGESFAVSTTTAALDAIWPITPS